MCTVERKCIFSTRREKKEKEYKIVLYQTVPASTSLFGMWQEVQRERVEAGLHG